MSGLAIQLSEWETLLPESDSRLHGLKLSRQGRAVAKDLAQSRKIEVLELVEGLRVRASSWVGRVELGELTVTVQPKIPRAPFLHLLRYAYGLRQLSIQDETLYHAEQGTFQDLIARQLASEVEEIIARGLHRDYRRESEALAVPRGQIDFQRYVLGAGSACATLPCIHYPRTRQTILNRVLQAGLQLATRSTDDRDLRARLRRLGMALNLDEPPARLHGELLQGAWRTMDRRTRTYQPALTLIGLLMQGFGISWKDGDRVHRLHGFLFDMNRFFQALISRFLGDNLPGYRVRDEHGLKGMFEYAPFGNPKSRRTPRPRPDFVVLLGNTIVSVLDAKYRNLWEHNLPREMLYQLAMYALGHSGHDRQAAILYPTLEGGAVDQTIVLNEPVDGTEQARIVLRPVSLVELKELIDLPIGVQRERLGTAMANRLAFGNNAMATH